MAYKDDVDLNFLQHMPSEDLKDLVGYLTKDKDGEVRFSEELTSNEAYKKHHPDHSKYWQEIAAEMQCFGANTFATMLRGGKGVPYREVLLDVCNKNGVKYDAKGITSGIEDDLLVKILGDALEKMPHTDRIEFVKSIGIAALKDLTPAPLTAALQLAFKAGGFKSYQLTLIIANAISRAILGHGVALAGNAALMRSVTLLAGPVGWALTGALTLVDLAGPAYRITMPSVIQVALLRRKYAALLAGYKSEIEKELGRL